MNLRLLLDSLAVVPHRSGIALNDAWSELASEAVGERLAQIKALRVIPNVGVRAALDADAWSPEEIGRFLHVTGAVICAATAVPPSIDLQVELIDVLAEATVGRQNFLSSAASASRLPFEASRTVLRWLLRDEPVRGDDDDFDDIADVAELRACALSAQYEQAIALCRTLRGRPATALMRREIARVIVDAPSAVLRREDVASAKRAVAGMATAEGEGLAARVACRFDLHWGRVARQFATACAKTQSPDVQASYVLLLIAMHRFDDAQRRLAWVASPRREAHLRRLMAAVLNGDDQTAMVAIGESFDHQPRDDAYLDAQSLAAAGKRSGAMHALERAVASWSPFVMLAPVDPAFTALRSTPRFRSLLRLA